MPRSDDPASFSRLGKRMLRWETKIESYDFSDAKEFGTLSD
jgi:hypothetical protein